MKKRIAGVLNFFAFNLLFFALYLNFVHRDNNSQPPVIKNPVAVSSKTTALVTNPEKYLKKEHKEEAPQTTRLQN